MRQRAGVTVDRYQTDLNAVLRHAVRVMDGAMGRTEIGGSRNAM